MTTSEVLPMEAPRSKAAIVITIAVLLLVFAGIYTWRATRLSAANAGYAPPPTEVSVTTVKTETLPQSLNATGSFAAVREVMLAPEVPGRVVAIGFTAGQRVEAGVQIVHLFDAPERADHAAAVARARFVKIQFDRSKALQGTGAEPDELLAQREAEYNQALAAIQQIDARIAQKTIRAPFSGQIGIRKVNPGQYLNAGDAIATLTALDRLYINFTVPQQQLTQLHPGGAVTVSSDALPGRSFTARINAIEPVVGNDTRNVSVQAEMPNPDRLLRPGLYATVAVAQGARADAILVPLTAVQTSASGDSVYIVKDGKAALVPITTGAEIGGRTVIESGLHAGDVVVTSGQIKLQPGAPVKVASPASVPAKR